VLFRSSNLTLVLYSVPEFWLGLGLMMVLALTLHLLPTTGMIDDLHHLMPPLDRIADRARHLVLPWLTLTLIGTSVFARFQRSAMREIMREPFVRTARSKGLRERTVQYRHALRAALLPVIAVGGLLFPTLLTGAVFVESIFNWPGMGLAMVTAASRRDPALVSGAVIVGAAMTTLGALIADLLREAADPRLRTESTA
jgi:peptide/nickel transport system permease protein